MAPLLSPYDERWAEAFEREAERLASVLNDRALRIEHVGSTSVPGLTAKPIIDIQISVAELIPLEPLAERLLSCDYHHLPLSDPPPTEYPFFHRPASWPTTHHIHLCIAGGDQERRHLAFRDWLRSHPEDRDAYAELKLRLARDVDPNDPLSVMRYSDRKGDFVRSIEGKALRIQS